MAIIRTPDQKVRVFISSTINELAEERKAAREAITNLRLTPVFFEAGARPHPPRDLYSAYLEQSHIFLGIYWNSYGWVAPGAEISGLEDEYRLCGNQPRLIYVKRSDERQPKLNDLLQEIENSDQACYQFFNNAEELSGHIENDLSVLMSEIFENALLDQQQGQDASADTEPIHHKIMALPFIRSEIYGREEDQKRLLELLEKPGVCLITLLGAGGTGKTTLSIHTAHKCKTNFRDGIAFIPLAPVSDHRLVGATIAEVLGVQDSGKQPIENTLIDFISDKNLLLIIDNFEQVIEASGLISDIITMCPEVKIIITSRTSLHIRNERIFNLGTLALPGENVTVAPEELTTYPATQLFVERALAVNPRMEFSNENTAAIIDICQRMDGLPLAIELAAARTKFFQPAALMSRIDKTLDLVSKGHKDLPERQQTLRAAIEWSYNLLTEDTQHVFSQFGLFKGSWTMEAADIIINNGGDPIDIEEMTERLMDVSLIKPVMVSHSAEPRFNMLQTVHEYAGEMLEQSPKANETKLRFANYYYELCKGSEWELWTTNAEAWLDKIEHEYQNIRVAFYFFISVDDYEKAWDLFYYMVSYWTMRGGFTEAMTWKEKAGIGDPDFVHLKNISKEIQGRTITWAALATLMLLRIEEGFALLYRGEEILEKANDEVAYAIAVALDACYGSFMGMPDAIAKIEKGKTLVENIDHHFPRSMFYTWSYEYYRQIGRMDIVDKHMDLALQIARKYDNIYILGTLYINRYSLAIISGDIDYESMATESLDMHKLFPAKGYKGLKSAAMSGHAYCLNRLKRPEEAEKSLLKALEYSRECGEKESEFYVSLEASYYFSYTGNHEKAAKIFGAVDGFIAVAEYPLVGLGEIQYNDSRKQVLGDETNTEIMQWYEEGKKMRLEDVIVYALNRD